MPASQGCCEDGVAVAVSSLYMVLGICWHSWLFYYICYPLSSLSFSLLPYKKSYHLPLAVNRNQRINEIIELYFHLKLKVNVPQKSKHDTS